MMERGGSTPSVLLLGGRIFVILGTPVLTAIGPLALQVAGRVHSVC